MKITCTICGKEKDITEYYYVSTRNHYESRCKQCKSEYNKTYREKNKDKLNEYIAKWRKDNPEKQKKADRKYGKENIKEILEKKKEYYLKNREVILVKRKEYRKNNKDKILKSKIKYYHSKPEIKLLQRLRTRLLEKLRGIRKAESADILLSCSIEYLKKHLESQFRDNMSWENYGVKGWHIDHILPCASFDLLDPEQQKACFNYMNLQPLWWYENLEKRDKLDFRIAT